MKNINIFDLPEKKISEIQEKYAILEPLLDTYLSDRERREYRKAACERLKVSERTLRRYVQKVREKGITYLARQERSDAGTYRVFSKSILNKAISLIEEMPSRSIPTLMKLLSADDEISTQVNRISPSTLYFHLRKAGYDLKHNDYRSSGRAYSSFEADYPNQLWQGDARHGIPLPHPDDLQKSKMTFLFGWIDDFSRQFMYARYYWDEKLPRMEDSFRQAVFRWGLPEKIYLDNGPVYISKAFLAIVNDLEVKKIHHPAYSAWCKGKIEAGMKLLKKFQAEAVVAGFKTIEELNSALFAWLDVEYHNKIHSSTGETPKERYRDNILKHPPQRVKDLDTFNSYFLMRDKRKIDKYGRISFKRNYYPISGLPIGTWIEVWFDPFDLSEVQIYHNKVFYAKITASKLTNKVMSDIPEERRTSSVSKASVNYFKKVREKHNEQKKREIDEISLFALKKKEVE